jgi:hypothetical protein
MVLSIFSEKNNKSVKNLILFERSESTKFRILFSL